MKKAAIAILIFFGLALSVNAALAQDYTGTLMNQVSSKCLGVGDCTLCDLIQVGVNFSDLIVAFSGAIAVLMFIIGGIMMITAYGSDRITMGKNIIVATIVGLLIIFTAWTVVNTLILALYGTTSTTFGTTLSTMTGGAGTAGNGYSYKCTAGAAK